MALSVKTSSLPGSVFAENIDSSESSDQTVPNGSQDVDLMGQSSAALATKVEKNRISRSLSFDRLPGLPLPLSSMIEPRKMVTLDAPRGQRGNKPIVCDELDLSLKDKPKSSQLSTRSKTSSVTPVISPNMNQSNGEKRAPGVTTLLNRDRIVERSASESSTDVTRDTISNQNLRTVVRPLRLSYAIASTSSNSTEVVYINPLYNDTRFVPDRIVKDSIPYFSSVASKVYYDCDKAETELSISILRYPGKRQFLIDTLIGLRASLTHPKHIARFDKVLILALVREGNESFLVQYFKHPGANLEDFAAKAALEFSKRKEAHSAVIKNLSRIIECEIKFQKKDDLFRQSCISSSIYRELGGILWNRELKGLKDAIARAVKNTDPASLCLEYSKVKAALRIKNSAFDSLLFTEQEALIQNELAANAGRFVVFARALLPEIYGMQIPPEFAELLAMRRGHIIAFLKKHSANPTEDHVFLSRTYISEAICLRILNPQILSADVPPEAMGVLVSLTKVVQCLAKETPFGAEKADPIFEMVNPLFAEFNLPHRQFIDRSSRQD